VRAAGSKSLPGATTIFSLPITSFAAEFYRNLPVDYTFADNLNLTTGDFLEVSTRYRGDRKWIPGMNGTFVAKSLKSLTIANEVGSSLLRRGGGGGGGGGGS
jgi:hypothetical protein